jgi:uncharacterized protein (TIGR00106 family)
MAIADISVTPLGTATPGVSGFVAECVKIVRESGLNYQLTPMGTVIEGDIEEIFRIVRRMHEAPFSAGALRVATLIKIDDRRDKPAPLMEDKVRSVEEKL